MYNLFVEFQSEIKLSLPLETFTVVSQENTNVHNPYDGGLYCIINGNEVNIESLFPYTSEDVKNIIITTKEDGSEVYSSTYWNKCVSVTGNYVLEDKMMRISFQFGHRES